MKRVCWVCDGSIRSDDAVTVYECVVPGADSDLRVAHAAHFAGPRAPLPEFDLAPAYAEALRVPFTPTERDWFAVNASEQDIATVQWKAGSAAPWTTPSREAARFLHADAMLAERAKREPSEVRAPTDDEKQRVNDALRAVRDTRETIDRLLVQRVAARSACDELFAAERALRRIMGGSEVFESVKALEAARDAAEARVDKAKAAVRDSLADLPPPPAPVPVAQVDTLREVRGVWSDEEIQAKRDDTSAVRVWFDAEEQMEFCVGNSGCLYARKPGADRWLIAGAKAYPWVLARRVRALDIADRAAPSPSSTERPAPKPDVEKLRKGLIAVADLIDCSTGVYGLHQNGDPAPWVELQRGGSFTAWLDNFDAALDELDRCGLLPQSQVAPSAPLEAGEKTKETEGGAA